MSTMRVTMTRTTMGESGSLLTAGSTYTVSTAFGAYLVGQAKAATDPDGALSPLGSEPLRLATNPVTGAASAVDPAGNAVSFAGPTYIWVNRPAASGNAGMVIRITDIGPTAFGSLWVSDGVNWNTLNGRQVLAAGRSGAPGSALTTVAAIGKMALPSGQMISGGSLVLPAGLIRVGVGLRVEAMIRHTGTAGTWTATWRIGTANTSGDSAIVSNGGSATNDQAQWAFMDLNFSSTSAAVTGFNMIPQGAAGAGSLAARTTNIDTAAAMYVAPHLSALTAPDTLELISYCISLHD